MASRLTHSEDTCPWKTSFKTVNSSNLRLLEKDEPFFQYSETELSFVHLLTRPTSLYQSILEKKDSDGFSSFMQAELDSMGLSVLNIVLQMELPQNKDPSCFFSPQ